MLLPSGWSQPRTLACMGTGEEVSSDSMMLTSGYASTTATGVEQTDDRECEGMESVERPSERGEGHVSGVV